MFSESLETILVESQSSSEAIARLYRLTKARNNRFSYSIVCRLSGITSHGFLSEIIHGRRVLPEKYADGMCRAFGLVDGQAEILKTLIQRDNLNEGDMRKEYEKRLATLRKLSHFLRKDIPSDGIQAFMMTTVLSAFGMFSLRATADEIKACFPSEDAALVDATFKKLLDEGYLGKDGEHYILTEKDMFLSGESMKEARAQYTHQVMEEAARQAIKVTSNDEIEAFESFVISVKASDCQKRIAEIRKQFRELAASLGVEDGDMVVRFNMQLYSLLEKPSAFERTYGITPTPEALFMSSDNMLNNTLC